MTLPVFKLLYLNPATGEHGKLPDYGITNSGGVMGPTFTVGGRALLFADGSPSDGSGTGLDLTLQGAYDASTPALIDLAIGKNFTIQALNANVLSIDASTGKVTITGDLEVQGSSTVIDGILTNVDQVDISPPDGATSALLIEPTLGVTMAADLMRVRQVNAGPSVFTIDQNGNTYIKQLTVGTTLNSVDFNAFYAAFTAHVTTNATIKHTADEISVTPLTTLTGSTVQEVLEDIDLQLAAATGGIKTFEFIQVGAFAVWNVVHNKNSLRPTVTIYDVTNHQVLPDEVVIVDANTIQVLFNTPLAGRAIILLF